MKQTRIKSKQFKQELQAAGYSEEQISISKKDSIIVCEDKDQQVKIIKINNQIAFFYYSEKLIPTLKFLQKYPNLLKKVTVDMSAIKFVAGGADIMRPGIKKIDQDITKDQIVAIVDETHGTAICLGKALLDTQEMQSKQTGKSLKNVHFIGDKIWNLI